jgi:hypothetical protein
MSTIFPKLSQVFFVVFCGESPLVTLTLILSQQSTRKPFAWDFSPTQQVLGAKNWIFLYF